MRKTIIAAAVVLVSLPSSASQAPRDAFDFEWTMRVDYVHSGGADGERFELDGVVAEPAWPGSQTQLIDSTDLGKYLFEVIDRESGRVIYSRGFASIYGEWETTAEFRTTNRTFHESLRFPGPKTAVRVSVSKRDARNRFQLVWSADVDERLAQRRRTDDARLLPVFESGPVYAKVDLLLMSEGYSAAQMPAFRSDAGRLVSALFSIEPFKSRRADFNVRLLEIAGSPLSVEFNVFGLARYALTYDNRALRDRASAAPYDVAEVLMNDSRYGGGGIFNQQSTVAASNAAAAYVFIHEFAHNLAGLGDEYVGAVTYETGAPIKSEPWEPNITALHDPATLKWRDLVEPGTPLPTPLSHAGRVGAFEGAGYESHGLYRPEAECIMGTRRLIDFCRVCRRAIDRAIDLYTR